MGGGGEVKVDEKSFGGSMTNIRPRKSLGCSVWHNIAPTNLNCFHQLCMLSLGRALFRGRGHLPSPPPLYEFCPPLKPQNHSMHIYIASRPS